MTVPPQRASWHPSHASPESVTEGSPSTLSLSGNAAGLLTGATALSVFVLGYMSLQLRPEGSAIAAFWPATGVAVAAAAVVTPRLRPLVLGGVAVAALAVGLTGDLPWPAV